MRVLFFSVSPVGRKDEDPIIDFILDVHFDLVGDRDRAIAESVTDK
jgi:hypothetical protein